MHLAPLPVVFVHFQYTIPSYAGFSFRETESNTHTVLTNDSQLVRCMFSYSITVRMHLAPLAVVFVLFYYRIPAYAGFASAKRKGDLRKLLRRLTSATSLRIRIFNSSLCATVLV